MYLQKLKYFLIENGVSMSMKTNSSAVGFAHAIYNKW